VDVVNTVIRFRKIRFVLVFFCAIFLLTNCKKEKNLEELAINYEAGRAVAVSFKLRQADADLECYLHGQRTTPVLGEIVIFEDRYQFIPVIPFSRGQEYEIRSNGNLLASFKIVMANKNDPGELKNIYPSRDTVPENLLKVYLEFSQPMQQVGEALNFISVIDETTAKEVDVFLALESELWNKNHDRLTLWLDPGRIKTDLIPNKELGLPLSEGHKYTLLISKEWKTADGIPLKRDYSKKLVVTDRDSQMPDPESWEIVLPVAGQQGHLEINFKESLDAILCLETLNIENNEGEKVAGIFQLGKEEASILFKPVNSWNKGEYVILVEAKLEDLAGNNINRLFDTDISKTKSGAIPKQFYKIRFSINE